MSKEMEKAIAYVSAHFREHVSEACEAYALEIVDEMRCPVPDFVLDPIRDLMEEYSFVNDLPEGWWLEEADVEDIYWKLKIDE